MKHPLSMTSEELASMPVIRKVIAKRNVCIFQPDIEFHKGWFAVTFMINNHLISCNRLITIEACDDDEVIEYLVNQRVEQFNETNK